MTETPTITDPTIKVCRDLAEIIDLSLQLLTQAVHDANAQIDGTSLPGGRAMIALAGVGDTDTFERRVELTERAWYSQLEDHGGVALVDGISVRLDQTGRPDVAADEDDEAAPALQIVRYWSERYRWQLGAVWDHIPTLATEAKFLRNPDVLAHITAHHADEFAPMSRDINHARLHLESILHAGRRPDTSRVVCNNPTCDHPKQLIRAYGPRYTAAWECVACHTTVPETRACDTCHGRARVSSQRRCERKVGSKDDRHDCGGELISTVALAHCPNPWCHTPAPADPVHESDPVDDRWKCTSCKKRYTDTDFNRAHAAMMLAEGAERFVAVTEAVATLVKQGRPEVTVRSWLLPPRRHVADRCKVCKRRWPPLEYNVCPGKVRRDSIEQCGGELAPVRRGNANNIIEAYCDLATHKTFVWWPDIWRRHLVTKAKADRRAAIRARSEQDAAREDGETA